MDWRRRGSLVLAGVALASLALLLVASVAFRGGGAEERGGYGSAAAYGQALFLAKGCTRCHSHAAVPDSGFTTNIGPSLTHYTNDPAFLRRWLRDPAAVKPGTQMPNRGLADAEIDALIAFLNARQLEQ